MCIIVKNECVHVYGGLLLIVGGGGDIRSFMVHWANAE